jgi:outer membrane receptor protein involved in Fe transport
VNDQDSTRINTLDLMQHGGEQDRNVRQALLKHTVGSAARWTNTLDLGYRENWSEALPYIEMPQAQVRVTSEFDDGTRGSRTLVFGGNRSMPSEAYGRDLEVPTSSAWCCRRATRCIASRRASGRTQPQRGTRHHQPVRLVPLRLHCGPGRNRPDRYERTLTEREAESGRTNIGLHVGDTWRVSDPLEFTLGVRWDYSRLHSSRTTIPLVESAFGRRTDIVPRSAAVSPRLGFNYRLPAPRGVRRSMSGGIGYFAGRAPTNIFSTAVRQTGLPNAEQSVLCIGSPCRCPTGSSTCWTRCTPRRIAPTATRACRPSRRGRPR